MLKFISLTIIIILFNIYAIQTQDPCNYENSNGLVTITCVNFQSFDQLNFVNVTDQVREINLKPSQLTLLDGKLDVYSIDFMDDYQINLENINGFSFASNPFVNNKKLTKAIFNLKNSVLDFYDENGRKIDFTNCDEKNRNEIFISLFDDFDIISLDEGVIYPDEFCPIEFKGVNIETFQMLNLTKSNKLKFMRIPINDSISDLNSTIKSLQIINSNIDLNTDLVYPEVFKKMTIFRVIDSVLTSIGEDFFTYFSKLKIFALEIYNFEEFINFEPHWLRHLNSEVKVNLSNPNDINRYKDRQMILELTDLSKTYLYPEKDFCLFRHFPHEKLVFPIIETKQNLECSCTLMWLLKNKSLFSNVDELKTSSVENCLFNKDFDKIVSNCDFNKKIEECKEQREETTDYQTLATVFIVFAVLLLVSLMVVVVYLLKASKKIDLPSFSFKPKLEK